MYNTQKNEHKFFGKRDRIFKAGWRHGIVGVDDADSPNTSIFYKEQHDLKLHQQKEKDAINNYRQKRNSLLLNILYRSGTWALNNRINRIRVNRTTSKINNNP